MISPKWTLGRNVLAACFVVAPTLASCWPMAWCWGPDGGGGSYYAEKVFGVDGKREQCFRENGKLRVQLLGCTAPANILWPGDKPRFDFQIENLTNESLDLRGKVDVIQYALRTPGEDFFTVNFIKLADCGSVPFSAKVSPKGFINLSFDKLPIPSRYGGYGVVFDFGKLGRLMGATTVRVVKPDQATNPKPYPRVMMDGNYPDVLERLGAVSNRLKPATVFPSDPEFPKFYAELGRQLRDLQSRHITTTIEFGGAPEKYQPMGVTRWFSGFKDLSGNPLPIADNAWLPQYDPDFKEYAKRICSDFGWPKGPVVGVKLYNEPWEGGGIDGWGADSLRYREMYAAMAQGVIEARKESGVNVLVGGCDSTSNTFDKLFASGDAPFLRMFDFHSMHYQGLDIPSTYKPWRNRTDVNGKPDPVRLWDTESWVANSDERVAAVLSGYCSVGYDRVVGIFADGFIQGIETIRVRNANGTEDRTIKRPWSVCAALAAFSHMVGDRPFRKLLFQNGLPYVMQFDGLSGPEDGTLVVVGDLGQAFNKQIVPFRSVKMANAKMTIKAAGDAFCLYDSYANPVKTTGGQITLPLECTGYYLRANGKPGSFAKLLAAVKSARIDGVDPVEIVAMDFTTPIPSKPSYVVKLTNVLNRTVTGNLTVSSPGLSFQAPRRSVTIKGNETLTMSVPVTSGLPTEDNTYPVTSTFESSEGAKVEHSEAMHVDVIAKLTPTIDGSLNDWTGALPQPISIDGVAKPTAQEMAWKPWEKFQSRTSKGFAVGYLGYDDQYFYFAAKIADRTPDEGMHRMENSNDDEWFYPAVVNHNGSELKWPEGVRRYSYAKQPELPAGNYPNHDNVQIGFNVLDESEKAYLPYPIGTMPNYGVVPTNDYEYALNPIAPKYGGGTEVWRLAYPGMPPKNFYPRQPKGEFDRAVNDGKLAIRRDGESRTVECAIPWGEIPHVRKALLAHRTIGFSFRVNDNQGSGCLELSRNRSVAKRGESFGVPWTEHWTNTVQFAFGD